MGNIKDKVAIVGMGCTRFGEHWDKSFEDLMIDAAYEAYADAGIGPNDIEAAWIGNAELPKRYGIPVPATVTSTLKLRNIPVTRVENACCTGHEAIRAACFGIASGMYDICLAIGVEKLKDTGIGGLGTGRGDHPVQEFRRTAPATFGMIATRYFYVHNLSPDEGRRTIGKISVKNHYNGSMCPKAHFHNKLTLEQVLNAPIIAWPLGLFDCCGNSDGAAAAILVRADMAKKFRDDPIYIKGLGVSSDQLNPVFRPGNDWLHWQSLISSAHQAYEQAGITNPREQLDVAEVHDCFSSTEMIIYENYGFSPYAKDDIDNGFFELGGGLPVNVDGGLKCFGHPVGASGIRMNYEIYKQLQGKADLPERQLKNVKLGLSETFGGPPQSSACAIVGKELGYP
jgi:Acetyl-CoA acetyltransferase